MRCFRSMHTVLRAGGRLTVALGLIGFLVANTGLPVVRPLGPRGKDKSRPFLCQDRPCGCMSADECLRGCCCFSARERLAWARSNDIEVPAELLAQVADELVTPPLLDGDHDHGELAEHSDGERHDGACCSRSTASDAQKNACAKCDHADMANHAACHDDECVGDGHDDDDHELAKSQGWQIAFIVGPLASQCRGLGPWSVLTFSALPPAAIVSYEYDWCSRGRVELVTSLVESFDTSPPTRPPSA
ncbi:MAG TPA: hypothetical protein VHD36_01735 [Pirellulales bacterium]|nr:hypothetical protein [Pirellulales bacterium]